MSKFKCWGVFRVCKWNSKVPHPRWRCMKCREYLGYKEVAKHREREPEVTAMLAKIPDGNVALSIYKSMAKELR